MLLILFKYFINNLFYYIITNKIQQVFNISFNIYIYNNKILFININKLKKLKYININNSLIILINIKKFKKNYLIKFINYFCKIVYI